MLPSGSCMAGLVAKRKCGVGFVHLKEASAEPITETSFDDDIEVEEPLVSTTPPQQDNSIITETDSETPALTEKERRKAERQAKREARRREKAQKNN